MKKKWMWILLGAVLTATACGSEPADELAVEEAVPIESAEQALFLETEQLLPSDAMKTEWKRVDTFDSSILRSGQAAPDTELWIRVYTRRADGKLLTWVSKEEKTGASGLYHLEINLPYIGEQQVLIYFVREDRNGRYCEAMEQLTCRRQSAAVGERLGQLWFNIYEELETKS